MANRSWELGYHLRSPRNWLNDPNGMCQFRGRYLVFYQYDHDWPRVDQKAWGEFSSPDLVRWRFEGIALEPSVPQDRHGVFSGCSFVEKGAAPDGGDLLRVYYTGNVVDPTPHTSPKDLDFVFAGRQGNTLTTTSVDGVNFGPRQVLLTNDDYPEFCSCHVRDPKVWEEDGVRHMLLGARHVDGHGLCLLYDSADGIEWTFRHAVEPEYDFGFVWECPNLIQIDSVDYLAVSPQGLPRERDRWFNRWTPGYFELPDRLLDTEVIDERSFEQWDFGHDFYAPQTFRDDAGRWILVGWMGTFDKHYTSVPEGLDWWHCLTVPREVRRREDGRLLQWPVAELESLRGAPVELGVGTAPDGSSTSAGRSLAHVDGRRADIELRYVRGSGALALDDSFEVFYEDGRLGIRYLDERAAAGRQARSVPADELFDLRVLVDGSAVEVFANDGAITFASRWFCDERPQLAISSSFSADGTVWPMEDVMSDVYASAVVPDIALPGWNQELDRS